MITSLRLIDFKNFADETLHLGPFTVLVGANASGKSNIRDAFRFLHGVGRGYTLEEIVRGKLDESGQLEWQPIRGGRNEIIRMQPPMEPNSRTPPPHLPAFRLKIEMILENDTSAIYLIEVSSEIGKSGFRITYERLCVDEEAVYEKPRTEYGNRQVSVNNNRTVNINLDKPALVQLLGNANVSEQEKGKIASVICVLENIYIPEFLPDKMRLPSFPSQNALGDHGENLPTVLYEICSDDTRQSILADWLRALTPMEVKGFEFGGDRFNRINLRIEEESGTRISAYSASDGTLRFLAILATLLGQDGGSYFFEEINSGIHPSRLHLLMDLIETQADRGDLQVIATTHSPDVLSIMNEETFRHTSVICRREGTNSAIIRPMCEIPKAVELRKSQGLGRLLAGGWMETALAFTEEDEDGEEMSG